MAELDSLCNKNYYNPEYHKKYYDKNKAKIIKKAKERWADLTEKEKDDYYNNRKRQRKLKKTK